MKRFVRWVFGVAKEWLKRSKNPPKQSEAKQKISQSGLINIYIDNGDRKD